MNAIERHDAREMRRTECENALAGIPDPADAIREAREALLVVEERLSAWQDGERVAQRSAEERNDRHAAEGCYAIVRNYEYLLVPVRASLAALGGGK